MCEEGLLMKHPTTSVANKGYQTLIIVFYLFYLCHLSVFYVRTINTQYINI